MVAEEFVEKIRYEADITDVQAKLTRLAGEQGALATSTGEQTGRMSGHWDGLRNKFGAVAGGLKTLSLGVLGVAGSAAVFGPQILSAGAEIEALGKKAATVFDGAALGQVQAWAEGVAGSLGMTRDQLVGATAGVADLLKPMGFTTAEAAKMSTGLVDLSGALSAWTGGTRSAKDVSEILTKALLGEREGLKELGISISEADVQARLAKNGTDELTGAAFEQAKALATQQLILEKSTDAQKAWADGSMDAIKQQNESKASMANLSETMTRAVYPAIQAMLPLVSKVAEWLSRHLPGAIDTAKQWFTTNLLPPLQQIAGWVKDNWPQISATFQTVFAKLGELASWLYDTVLQPLLAGIGEVVGFVADHWKGISETIEAVFKVVQTAVVFVVETVLPGLVKGVGAAIQGVVWAWDNVLRPVVSTLGAIFSTAWAVASPAVEVIKTQIGWLVTAVVWAWENLLEPTIDKLGSFFSTAWAVAEPVVGTIEEVVTSTFDAIGTAIDVLAAPFKWLFDQLTKVYGAAKDSYDMVRKALGGVAGSLVNVLPLGGSSSSSSGGTRGYHNGGVVDGLPSGEVITKLLVGETVRTRSQEAALQARMAGVTIGTLNVTSTDSPRRWFDEGLWRVAG